MNNLIPEQIFISKFVPTFLANYASIKYEKGETSAKRVITEEVVIDAWLLGKEAYTKIKDVRDNI